MIESQQEAANFWYLLVLERSISHRSALPEAWPLLATWLLVCGILSCVDLSHKRIVEIAFSGPASRVSRAASWATFMTALTVLTSLTSLLSYKRAANWRVLQSLFRSTVVRFFAKADSTFLTLIDSMAQTVVIFKASFAYIAARLAILVDRVLHRLEHIA